MDIREEWSQTSFWKKVLIVLVFGGIISYVIYVFLVESKKEELELLESEVESLRSQAKILDASTSPQILEKINRELYQIKLQNEEKISKIEAMKKSIPEKPDIDSVIRTISTVASLSKIHLANLKVEQEEETIMYYEDGVLKVFEQKDKDIKPPETSLKIRKINLTVSLFGDVRGFFEFLNRFSNIERIISINSVEIKKEANLLKYLLSVSVYYNPPEE